MKKQLTVTIGIPTCYGGRSLLKAIRSMHANSASYPLSILVCADSVPIPKNIKRQLSQLDVTLIENKVPGTQMKKVKQIIDLAKSDMLVITHDDVLFDRQAIANIVAYAREHPNVSMIGTTVLPQKPITRFESVIEVGLRVVSFVGSIWRNGDNYLMANGRCLAFQTKHIKNMHIDQNVVNGDAYLYFENKRIGGSFGMASSSKVYIGNPKTLAEHMRQSHRFMYSQNELRRIFGADIEDEYKIPRKLRIMGLAREIVKSPLQAGAYLLVLCYTMAKKAEDTSHLSPFWKVNASTKL